MGEAKRRPPGRCIFCEQLGVTKQHVFPDWLKRVIPRDDQEHTQLLVQPTYAPGNVVIVVPTLNSYQGPLGSRKIRNICQTCNNGWISALENRVKPLLSSLIRAEVVSMSIEDQTQLAAWIAEATIVAEFTDRSTMGIPVSDRRYVFTERRAPPEWRIWLGWHAHARWHFRYRHHGYFLKQVESAEEGVLLQQMARERPLPPNAQASAFGLGELFIYIRSGPIELKPIAAEVAALPLVEVWPAMQEARWPPIRKLADSELDMIADESIQ